jgi:molecular chaperone DnaK
MAQVFGLDFGTTNSLAAFVQNGQALSLLGEDNLPHPSVVWFHGSEIIVGRRAKQHLSQTGAAVLGDLVRSPKAFLGSGGNIHVGGIDRSPRDVVSEIIRHIRTDAISRKYRGLDFTRAIITIPVNMTGRGRKELRDAALKAGLHIVQFVHEPLAALYGHLRSLPETEFKRRMAELEGQTALVFDWGGGTLDLTLCKFIGGTLVQIQNKGDNNVGGDRFDERLVRNAKSEHANQYGLMHWPGEMPNADAKLLSECETAKITLSSRDEANIFIPNFLRAEGPERNLELRLTKPDLERLTRDLIDDGLHNIDSLLESAGIKEGSVALCLATGGMVKVPYIRERLLERFGLARVPLINNSDRIIAEGAAWIANDGLRLRLAKPFELLHADDTYVPIISEHVDLPTENNDQLFKLGMYCVDPRDGFAKFQFARPKWPGRSLQADPRHVYTALTVNVDPTAKPLLERLEVEVIIDHDLIVTANVRSSLVGDEAQAEIHDLEFGLGLAPASEKPRQTEDDLPLYGSQQQRSAGPAQDRLQSCGNVRLRSNISLSDDAWDLVPGEIVSRYAPAFTHFDLNPHQQTECSYYWPCSNWLQNGSRCGRLLYDIKLNGCDACAERGLALSRSEAVLRRGNLDDLTISPRRI